MNHEQFIRKHLEKHVLHGQSRARKIQREIIAEVLLIYKRNQYPDIDELLSDSITRLKEYAVIGRGTTVKKFAVAMSVSRTTSRRHLLKLDRIIRNESRKPFIYTVGKA